jgi:flagellar biogenesis protein FliO
MVFQAASALVAVLELILVAAWLARRHGVARVGLDPAALRLRATLALDARRRLHLVDTAAGAALILTGGDREQVVMIAGVAPREPAA